MLWFYGPFLPLVPLMVLIEVIFPEAAGNAVQTVIMDAALAVFNAVEGFFSLIF
ncbi:MAG: hypothetical protein IJF40_06950 [Clostridia bacterium]|nr:hypothetical protein [Clostridia bacterium]